MDTRKKGERFGSFRDMGAEDLPGVMGIVAFYPNPPSKNIFISYLNKRAWHKYALVHHREVIAFFVVTDVSGGIQLAELYVHPKYQRNGIGTSVLLNVVKQSHEKSVFAWIRDSNYIAQCFLSEKNRRLGKNYAWKAVHQKKEFYKNPSETGILMGAPLTPQSRLRGLFLSIP